jgi:hypothetical protein
MSASYMRQNATGVSLTTYTLTVDDLAEPAQFDALSPAVEALRSLLLNLPVEPAQREAYRFFLEDPERAADFIHRDGRLLLPFKAGGITYTAVITAG